MLGHKKNFTMQKFPAIQCTLLLRSLRRSREIRLRLLGVGGCGLGRSLTRAGRLGGGGGGGGGGGRRRRRKKRSSRDRRLRGCGGGGGGRGGWGNSGISGLCSGLGSCSLQEVGTYLTEMPFHTLELTTVHKKYRYNIQHTYRYYFVWSMYAEVQKT